MIHSHPRNMKRPTMLKFDYVAEIARQVTVAGYWVEEIEEYRDKLAYDDDTCLRDTDKEQALGHLQVVKSQIDDLTNTLKIISELVRVD